MDAILEFITSAWEWIADFFLNTIGLQGLWDTITGWF